MKLNKLIPMLRTNELSATIDFYTTVVGFTCRERNDDWGWAALQKDEVELMLANSNALTPFDKPTFTGSFYFRTDEVDALWEELRDKTTVVYPIDNFDWEMREFAIYDNNGYTLQFGQEINPK